MEMTVISISFVQTKQIKNFLGSFCQVPCTPNQYQRQKF